MSLIIQSSGGSIRWGASADNAIAVIEVPPAVTAGDIVVLTVSATIDEDIILTGRMPGGDLSSDPFPGASVLTFPGPAGRIQIWHFPVPDKASADRLKGFSEIRVGVNDQDSAQITATMFRVTGADPVRFIEDAKSVSGSLAAEGELSIPSFDPEYRMDNTLLFIASATFSQDAATPGIVVERSAPVGSVTTSPTEGDGDGIVTALAIRSLTTADPTGVSRVAYSSQPASGLGVALMLRSANNPPVVNLATEWAAEIGREATVFATVSDPDFTPVSYVWTQVSGPENVTIGNVYSRAFNFTPTEPGVYRFLLRATDVDGGRTDAYADVIVPTGVTGPSEVLQQAGWVGQDGGDVDAAELGDDSDLTFARTLDLPIGDPLTVKLNPIYGGAAVTLTVRGVASNPSPAIRRSLTLKQSDGTLIAERFYTLPTVMGSYVFQTTRNETKLITNRSAMTLTIVDEVA